MSKASIRSEIMQLGREINSLENNLNLYKKMNSKISNAINQLTSANTSTMQAYTLLGQYYQSKAADKKISEIGDEQTSISSVINTLSGIIEASNSKIESIVNSISRKRNQIEALRIALASIDD